MKLNHLNLAVSDVPKALAFFEKYFGLRSMGGGKLNETIAGLFDDTGLVLTLSNFKRVTEVAYPEGFHVGFTQESTERVDEIHQRLKDDGFDVKPPGRYHGSWAFYLRAPGGVDIEVSAGLPPRDE